MVCPIIDPPWACMILEHLSVGFLIWQRHIRYVSTWFLFTGLTILLPVFAFSPLSFFLFSFFVLWWGWWWFYKLWPELQIFNHNRKFPSLRHFLLDQFFNRVFLLFLDCLLESYFRILLVAARLLFHLLRLFCLLVFTLSWFGIGIIVFSFLLLLAFLFRVV